MLKLQKELQISFTELLKQFLTEQSESTLTEAYELGRNALANGVGELEVLRIYHQALQQIDEHKKEHSPQLFLAMDFLSEFLAPYEMRQRGFKDLIEELNEQNHQLREEVLLRKKTEKKLQSSKEYFQQLIENAQDIITVIDNDGLIKFVSTSLKRILGYNPEKVIGENIFDFICESDHFNIKKELTEIIKATGKTIKVEFRIKHENGSYRYLESIAQNVGKNSGIIVNSRDVTERVVAHQKLQESQNKLSEAQHLAKLGNWEWNVKEDTIYWSEEMCRIFGIGKDEYPKNYKEYLEFVYPGESAHLKEILNSSLKDHRNYEFERKVVRPDGDFRIMYSRGNVITNEHGEVIKVVGTGQDITKIKEAENQLRHYSKQLKSYMANEERSREEERIRIAREVHDELGQMLTVLKLDVSMMLMDAQSEMPLKKGSEFMKGVKLITKRIDTIIKSVQRIAKELRPDIFDHLGLDEALQWQAREFEKRTGIKQTLKNEVKNLETLSDERSIAIYRIFQETLTNILRHANASKVDIHIKQEKEQLVLTVRDDGDGIDEEKIKKSNSLGIVGMRERSQLLRGEITFTGKKGKGTTVTLKIPLKETSFSIEHKKVI